MSTMLKLTCSSCGAAYQVAASLVRGRVVNYRCKHCHAHNLTDGRSLAEGSNPDITAGNVSADVTGFSAMELAGSHLGEASDAHPAAPDPSPMRVFLGWSGERSRAVAAVLREQLPDFVDGIEPWMSDEGENGAFSAAVGSDKFEGGRFGILCVTPENQHATWIHYDAGACAKLFRDSRAATYLYDLIPSQLKPPLGLLQVKPSTETGTWEMVRAINAAVAAPLPEDGLRRRFEAFWPQLAGKLAEVPREASTVKTERAQPELVGEILDRVRGIETFLSSRVTLSSLSDQIWDVCQLVLQEIRDTHRSDDTVTTLAGIPMPKTAPVPREASPQAPARPGDLVFAYDEDDESTGLHSSAPPPVVAVRESSVQSLDANEHPISLEDFSADAGAGDISLDEVPLATSGTSSSG